MLRRQHGSKKRLPIKLTPPGPRNPADWPQPGRPVIYALGRSLGGAFVPSGLEITRRRGAPTKPDQTKPPNQTKLNQTELNLA